MNEGNVNGGNADQLREDKFKIENLQSSSFIVFKVSVEWKDGLSLRLNLCTKKCSSRLPSATFFASALWDTDIFVFETRRSIVYVKIIGDTSNL